MPLNSECFADKALVGGGPFAASCVFATFVGIIKRKQEYLQFANSFKNEKIARNRDCAMIENQQRGMSVVSIGSVSSLSSSQQVYDHMKPFATNGLSSATATVVSDHSNRSEEKERHSSLPTESSPLLLVTFPVKLRMMLDHVHENGLEDIVSWEVDGKAFKVHKPKDFESRIMSSFFNQTKFKSFQRQLNFHGFVRISSGKTKGCYLHKLFLRDDPSLCKEIARRNAVCGGGGSPSPISSLKGVSGVQRRPSVVSDLDASSSSQYSRHQTRDCEADMPVPSSILLASSGNTGPRGFVDTLDGKCYDSAPACVSVNSFPVPNKVGKVTTSSPEDAFERLLDKVLAEEEDVNAVLGGMSFQETKPAGNNHLLYQLPSSHVNDLPFCENQGMQQQDFSWFAQDDNYTFLHQV